MRAPREFTSLTEPARTIGQHLHSDLILLKHKSIGGNTVILRLVDEKSDFIVGIPMETKSTINMQAAGDATILAYNMFGHKVFKITTDDEVSLGILKPHLGKIGVTVTPTPAELHEKRIERHIQTIKDRKRAILTGLAYELLPELETEAYLDAIHWINCLPHKHTSPSTSYEFFTKI